MEEKESKENKESSPVCVDGAWESPFRHTDFTIPNPKRFILQLPDFKNLTIRYNGQDKEVSMQEMFDSL